MPRIIQVEPYDPRWPHLFRQEARRIVAGLSDQIILIHHIGSTAIPGIKAKPIVDFLVEARQIETIDEYNKIMIALGYDPRGEHGIPGRRYFVKRTADTHTHHLHIFQIGHPNIPRHLNFRDYLRIHPVEAQAYNQLKEKLAKKFRSNPEAYTRGKSEFVCEIDRRAAQWRDDFNDDKGD